MANKIQIKRSVANATVTGLSNGELAFTQAGNTLHIGLPDGSGVLRIGGAMVPGILTANQALVANSTGFIDEVRTANLVVGKVHANGGFGSTSQLLASGGSGSNAYWVDAGTLTTQPAGSNTQVQYNNSNNLGASAAFTFDQASNTLAVGGTVAVGAVTLSNTGLISVGNSSVNTQIAAGNVFLNGSTLVVGNTATNVTVNSTTIAIGTTIINATTFTGTANNADFLGGVAAADYQTEAGLAANVALLAANSASYLGSSPAANYVQNTDSRTLSGNLVFSGADFQVTGTTANVSSNVNITGSLTTISSNVNIGGAAINATSATLRVRDAEVSGNLTINGTLTTINTTSLSVRDALIKVADQNISSDTIDFGFYGSSGNATATWYAGLYRDHSVSSLESPVFKLFATNTEPTTTVGGANYAQGTLWAYLNSGGLISNTSAVTITANSTVAVNITANSLSLGTPLSGTSGGTGLNSYTAEDILVANSSNGFRKLGLGTSGYVLQSNGSALVYDTLDGGTF